MTRKAHNVDRQRTEETDFFDKRSYWTQKGHVYLFGEDAKNRRALVFAETGGICSKCHIYTPFGELDHIKGGNTDDRCWCLHNLRWICRDCHRKKHVQVQWTKKEKVSACQKM